MAFGQQSGPPASTRHVQELLELLHGAGHADFRDARGPMGFTQRQAAGKFTRQEAEAFINGLQNSEVEEHSGVAAAATSPSLDQRTVRRLPSDQLAAELRRRGWTVAQPPASPR